ncbi:hypothetical protein EJB05_31453 [Eragrostis curvula]|uniref:DUF674 domain-containing protein n=1 Tax=Eragrostis curvula TaxID=38414 RepID=A0A5J9UEW2_9POAL|nr:hypothetical protein EJB05_31453 [Eragrostis curvula]
MDTNELSIKLLIDTKAQKVCFAEAGSDVVEFLSSLLSLPVSTVIKLLTKERMVGSIGNVLDSMQEIDAKYIVPNQKEPYLSPAIAPTVLDHFQQLLGAPLIINTSFFTCEGRTESYNRTQGSCGYLSAIKDTRCPRCSKSMNKAMNHVKADGFVVRTATYTIKDDLSITQASSVSSVSLLAQCGVKDLSTLQEKTTTIGKEEVLEILLASLKSRTVLTDVFLQKKKVRCKKETAP